MRFLALALLASPATAWEFSPSPICTLYHADAVLGFTVTFDPSSGIYALSARFLENHPADWPESDVFFLEFDGPHRLRLATDQHIYSDDMKELSVSDRGFGNVLDGLEFNDFAEVISGDMSATVDLTGAAQEVRKFRDCGEIPLS